MFKDVGGKLKVIAKVFFWIMFVSNIVLLFLFFDYLYWIEVEIATESDFVQQPSFFPYFIVMLFFLVISMIIVYVLALCLYGFGVLIDNSSISNEITTHIAMQNNETNNTLKEINNKISKKTE